MLTENTQVPEWVKVKTAAVIGVTVPWLTEFFDKAGPLLDGLIKVGQFGVAVVTILYIWAKWRKTRKSE